MTAQVLMGRYFTLAALLLVFACDSSAPADTKSTTTTATPQAAPANPDTAEPAAAERAPAVELHPKLATYLDELVGQLDSVPAERRKQLDKLALFIKTKRDSGEAAKLVFICTHNSRRSHMSQLWASVAAAHYRVTGIETYSGGTEVTAFNPRAVAALERAGFEIDARDESDNPRYAVSFAPDGPTLEAFSKQYTDAPNPREGFAAIMTCSEADKNCPMVEGAALRVPIPYVDPKESDGSAEETAIYDERTRQIAIEMFYLLSKVAAA